MDQTKKESSKMVQATESRPAPPALERRAARNDQGLMITCIDRQYRVRGVSLHNFERLRVNIRASKGEVFHIDSLDLYQSRARRGFAAHLAKLFQVELPMVDADLLYMIGVIEAYQVQLLNEEKQPQKPVVPVMTAAEQEAAMKFLKRPDLTDQIIEDLETLGHVGEENRKLLGYLIAVSRKLERPLSGIVISQSGAGKSGLVEKIQELTPPEDVEFFSRFTPQALYYMEPDTLKRKLLIIEERSGGEGADYSIRTLQSRQKLTQAVPIKDPNSGKIKTMTFEVEGPIAYLETTTNPNINHENATRCFEIFLDESIEQKACGFSERTIPDYLRCTKRFLTYLEAIAITEIADVDLAIVNDYQIRMLEWKYRDKPLTNHTRAIHLVAVRCFFRALIKLDLI
jgi:hypothetical protein